jgi:protein Tex
MEIKYLQKIAESTGIAIKQIISVNELHSEGSTIPFIARYRKEATGNMDEVQIADVIEQIKYFAELEKRKETVIKTIEGLGKLTPELKKRIEDCTDTAVLEDIYLPYKPKRKTKASVAIEKGLEPLADILLEQKNIDVTAEANKFITESRLPSGVKDAAEALQGARDIIAERVSENEQARNAVRKLFQETAFISSRVLTTKKEDENAQKYRDYFEFKEPLSQSPSHIGHTPRRERRFFDNGNNGGKRTGGGIA